MDDVWVLHDSSEDQVATAARWLSDLDEAWRSFGVESHEGKAVNNMVLGEIQGAEAGDEAPTIGLGGEKVLLFMMTAVDLACSWKPLRRLLERWVGKASHLAEFCPPLRSCLQEVYPVLQEAREQKTHRVVLSRDVVEELLTLALLSPLSRFDLSSEWSTLVGAFDASPGRHGLSLARVPTAEVVSWAAVSCFRGDRTCLADDPLADVSGSRCLMKKAPLPLAKKRWTELPRPGGYSHSIIEEWHAYLWLLRERRDAERRPRPSVRLYRRQHVPSSQLCEGDVV